MKLVEIRWLDAFSRGDAGWQDHDEMPGGDDRLEISSVGWLLRSTKEYRVLLPNTHVERGGRGSGALALRAGKPKTANWTGRWVCWNGGLSKVRLDQYGLLWLVGCPILIYKDTAELLPRWRGWLLSVWRHRHGEKRWVIDLCACAIGLMAGLILFCWVLP